MATIDVFLSYSRKDTAGMRQLRTTLEGASLSVWTDEDLEVGTPAWESAIEDAIRRARCMVVILSPSAKMSEWIKIEIAIAKRHKLRIFPILITGDEDSAVPPSLTVTQFVDARQGFREAINEKLLPALRLYLSLPESVAPTPGNIPRRIPYLWVALVLLALVVGSLGFYFVDRFMFPQQPVAPTLVAIESTPALVAETPTSPPRATPRNTETPEDIASTQAAMPLAEMSIDATPTREATPTPTETPIPKPTATSTSEPTATDTPLPQPTVTSTEVPAPVAGATRTNPKDDAIYVYVPDGPFTMGSGAGDSRARDDEKPQTTLNVPGFWIMRTEVTNAQYGRCVQASACDPPENSRWKDPAYAEHPVTNVSWLKANEYAKWVGGRLPTEAEWEKACRGTDGRIYPWGNSSPTGDVGNFDNNVGHTTPVGQYSTQAGNPYGLADMAGNVWEWTNSQYQPYPYKADDGRESQEADVDRTLRSGSWNFSSDLARCANRDIDNPDRRNDDVGFRVVTS